MISLLVNVNNNMYSHIATQTPPYTDLGTHHLISGGGGARVFVACKLFFLPPRENNLFFWRSTSDNFFFMFCQRNFLSYASPIM